MGEGHWGDSREVLFWKKTNKLGPIPEKHPELGRCWVWMGAVTHGAGKGKGEYGVLLINYRKMVAHKFSYELSVGKIPEGHELHHVCENKLCVNHNHLQLVTKVTHPRVNSSKTHCPQGHEYNQENTEYYHGGKYRRCKICKNKQNRMSTARKFTYQGKRI